MTLGTLAVFWYGLQSGNDARALTLAFTTFVLFQFFNAFNARAETGSAFAQHFFGNRMLWLALAAVLALQVVVVHWEPAQAVFGTTTSSLADWGVAAAVASSVLLLEEARKLVSRIFRAHVRQRRGVRRRLGPCPCERHRRCFMPPCHGSLGEEVSRDAAMARQDWIEILAEDR